MKGQVSVISVVMISGIVIALVGTAYMWGLPIIEKRSVDTEFNIAKSFVFALNDLTVNMANAGSGRETLDIPNGLVRVVPSGANDPDNNSIIFEFEATQPMIFNQSPVYLGGATFEDVISEAGTYGVSSPGVISMTSRTGSSGYVVAIKLHFRELETKTVPRKGYKILLETGTGTQASGTSELTVSFVKTETQASACCGGAGPLVATRIRVDAA